MNWRGIILDNWPYKVAALVLALLLWFNVTADERQDYPVVTALEVELRDEDWVVVEVPAQVRTIFQGRRGDAVMLAGRNPPVIRRVLEDVSEPVVELELNRDMVSFDRDLNVRPVAVQPSMVQVRMEPRITRRLPVRPNLDVSVAPGFTVVGSPLLQPDSVSVRGAESEVETLEAVPTERITLEDLRTSVTREVSLSTPPGVDHVSVEPETVLATVEVDTLEERSITRPLALRGAASNEVEADVDSVTVSVRGPKRSVDDLDPGGVSAWAIVDSLPEGEVRVPVQVETTGDPPLTLRADPSEVSVRQRAAGGGTP